MSLVSAFFPSSEKPLWLVTRVYAVAFPVYTWGNPLRLSGWNSHQGPNHSHPVRSMFSKTFHFWQHKNYHDASQLGAIRKYETAVYLTVHFLSQIPISFCNNPGHCAIKCPQATAFINISYMVYCSLVWLCKFCFKRSFNMFFPPHLPYQKKKKKNQQTKKQTVLLSRYKGC